MKKLLLFIIVVFLSAACSNQGSPTTGNENTTISKKYAEGEILVLLKEGVDADTLFTGANSTSTKNIKSTQKIERLFNISTAVNKVKGLKSFKNISSKNDEDVFTKAYPLLSRTEQKLYRIYKIKVDINKTESTLAELKANKKVEHAQLNYLNKLCVEPNDERFDELYGIKNIQSLDAWNITEGEDVIVGVIDSGIDYNHPDIVDNMWTDSNGKYGYDFSDSDDDPIDDDSNSHGHGSHVAGTIAATGNNEIGVIGVAPKVKVMAVKVFPNAYDDVMAAGIKYAADNGAKVINNSWGPQSRISESPIIEAALDYAYEKGVIAIFAAGNENDDVQYYAPANYGKTISVAAVDENDTRAYFSNYGELVDVSAPGVDILSLSNLTTDYKTMSGTSMAAPHVTGMAALLVAQNPNLTFEDVRFIMKHSTDDAISEDEKSIGSGRINSYQALNYIQDISIPGNIQVTNFTETSLSLSWTPVDGADKYKLYKKAETEEEFSELSEITGSSAQSITVYYRSDMFSDAPVINIHYNVDNNGWTSVPGISMESVTSGTYSGWKSKKISGSTLEFVFNNNSGTWDNNNNNNYYISSAGIYELNNGNLTKIGEQQAEPASTYTENNLEEGTIYYYKVKAYKGTTESEFSETASGLTKGLSSPKVFTISNIAEDSLRIGFDERPNAVAYQVYRSTSENGNYEMVKELSGREIQIDLRYPSWQWSSYPWATYMEYKTPGQDWTVQKMTYYNPNVRLNWAYLEFENTLEIEFRFFRGDDGAPDGVRYEIVDNNGLNYKVTEYGYYDVDRNGVLYKTGDANSHISNLFYDTNLEAGTTYFYKFKTIGMDGESAFSKIISATTAGITAPKNLVASSSSIESISLSWDSVNNAESYLIFRSSEAEGEYLEIDTSGTNSFIDIDVTSGTTYFYKVKAQNSESESLFSNMASATPKISYTSTYEKVYFRGTPNGWGATEMTLVADYTWETTIAFINGDNNGGPRFKFDIYNDWSLNFGDNNSDNYADQNGNDIPVNANKTYKITFIDNTKGYYISEQ